MMFMLPPLLLTMFILIILLLIAYDYVDTAANAADNADCWLNRYFKYSGDNADYWLNRYFKYYKITLTKLKKV